MKAVIYARKSTSKIGQKETIENQIKICRRKAKELGIEVVDVKKDTATGTDDNNRQEVKDLIKGALDGKYDCVIMKGVSRFYRDVEKGLGLIKKLDRSSIRVVTVEENFDSLKNRTGTGQLDTSMITMFLMFAENESKKSSERIKHTQIEKAHSGEWNQAGSIPFGYNYDKKTKKLVVDYSSSKIIELIFKLYSEGIGMKSVAHYLNGDNSNNKLYPSPKDKKWSQYTIGFMLRNQVYVGDVVYNKRSKNARPYKNPESLGKTEDDVYIGNDYNNEEDWIITLNAHEAIISRELFEKVQSIIKTKGVRTGVRNNTSLLAGLAKCGKCEKGMTFKRGNKDKEGNIRTKSNYYCSSYIKYGKRYCTSHHVGALDFEELIISDLQNEINNRLNKDVISSNVKTNKLSDNDSLDKNIKKMERDIEDITHKMNVLLEKNISGSVSDLQFEQFNKKLTIDLEFFTGQLVELKTSKTKVTKNESDKDYLKMKIEEVKNISFYTKEQQRYLLHDLIGKIIFNDGDVEIEYRF